MTDDRPAFSPGQPLLRGSPNHALFGATVGFFIGFGAVSLFGPTAHSFVQVMHLTPEQVGFLVAIPMLTGSLLRIPFGAWVDTTGGKLPFLILLILSVVGIGGLYYMLLTLYPDHLDQSHYPLLLVFGALGGCGIATFSVGIGQVSYWFPKRNQGWALAAYAGLGNTSPGLVALILPLLIIFIGLWGAYLVSLAIVIVGIVLYFFLGHNAPYFQLRRAGVPAAESREQAAHAGQRTLSTGQRPARVDACGGGMAHLAAGNPLLHHLRWLPRSHRLVPDLLAELLQHNALDCGDSNRDLLAARFGDPRAWR